MDCFFFRKRTVWFLGLTIGLGPDDVDVPMYDCMIVGG
jgi:hypothetical protein